jgi:hypothetical protein
MTKASAKASENAEKHAIAGREDPYHYSLFRFPLLWVLRGILSLDQYTPRLREVVILQ